MSTAPREPTEAELAQMREAYEAELKQITTADVVIQTAVTLINLAGRRLGLAPDTTGDERDLEQVRDAIDAVRGLMGVLERVAPEDIAQLRGALSQLQMAYASEIGAGPADRTVAPPGASPAPAAPGAAPAPPAAESDSAAPGPAQSSGRLWIPGS